MELPVVSELDFPLEEQTFLVEFDEKEVMKVYSEQVLEYALHFVKEKHAILSQYVLHPQSYDTLLALKVARGDNEILFVVESLTRRKIHLAQTLCSARVRCLQRLSLFLLLRTKIKESIDREMTSFSSA